MFISSVFFPVIGVLGMSFVGLLLVAVGGRFQIVIHVHGRLSNQVVGTQDESSTFREVGGGSNASIFVVGKTYPRKHELTTDDDQKSLTQNAHLSVACHLYELTYEMALFRKDLELMELVVALRLVGEGTLHI